MIEGSSGFPSSSASSAGASPSGASWVASLAPLGTGATAMSTIPISRSGGWVTADGSVSGARGATASRFDSVIGNEGSVTSGKDRQTAAGFQPEFADNLVTRGWRRGERAPRMRAVRLPSPYDRLLL